MTDGGDHRCSSAEHRVRHDSLIKCPQVFQASTAAGDDHGINSQLIGTPIDGINGTGDRGRSSIALHWNINHQDAHERRTQAGGAQHILQRGAGGAGDDSNRARVIRERTLARFVKVALFAQRSAQLFVTLLQ